MEAKTLVHETLSGRDSLPKRMSQPSQPPTFALSLPTKGGSVTLAGDATGHGTDVLLLHGLSAARRQVVQGSRHLLRRGCRLIGYDARGHGESSPAPDAAAYEYAALVEDLERVIGELGLGDPLVLVGSSMGAATAMAFALARPDRVAGLVQITPAYDGRPRRDPEELASWDRMAAAVRAGDVDGFVQATGDGQLPDRWRESARTATRQRIAQHRHPEAVADALRVVPRSAAWDGIEALESLEVPVLVVGSRDEVDPMHPLDVAREYERRLPDARLVVEQEGESPLAWRGASLSRAIGDFLEGRV